MAKTQIRMPLLLICFMLQPAAVIAARRKAYRSAVGLDSDDLGIVIINDDTPPVQMMKIQKNPAFQQMWPKDCGGVDSLVGENDLELETNGFVCGADRSVAAIADPVWKERPSSNICCHKVCMDANSANKECHIKDGMSLPSAAAAASEAKNKFQTKDGVDIEMDEEEGDIADVGDGNSPEAPDNGGDAVPEVVEPDKPVVIKTLQITFGERALHFVRGKGELTEDSKTFFQDLKPKLDAKLSMELSALQDRKPRVLLCAHASSTANNPDLVNGRAATIDKAIRDDGMIGDDVGEVGQPWGHVPQEDGTDFGGGAYGVLIIKFYEGDKPKPECNKADLHGFKRHMFKFRSLVGYWDPIKTKGEKGIPTSWENKKVTIQRKAHTPNVQMQMWKRSGKSWKAKSDPTDMDCKPLTDDPEKYVFLCTVTYKYKSNGYFSDEYERALTMKVRASNSLPGAYTMLVTDTDHSGKHKAVDTLHLRNTHGANNKAAPAKK